MSLSRRCGRGVASPGKLSRGCNTQRRSDAPLKWAEDFVSAGLSALMLAFAGLSDGLRLLAVVALTPYLARASAATARSAIRLGLMLAFAYGVATASNQVLAQPILSAVRFLGLASLFVSFSLFVTLARERIGLVPTLIPLFWVALDMLFARLGIADHVLPTESPSSQGVCMLLGTTAVSFLIVLVNSLALYAAVRFTELFGGSSHDVTVDSEQRAVAGWCEWFDSIGIAAHGSRGPPAGSARAFV